MVDATLPPIPPTRIHVPEEDIRSLQGTFAEILKTGQLTLGKHTTAFENEFGKYLGMPHAVAVNSGTSAIEIILRALRVSDSDVVVPTNTFAATAFAVVHSGNRPRLADVGDDLCMTRDSLEAATTPKTKVAVLVHIGGLVASDSQRIAALCRDRGIALVEDAAHAQGSTLDNRFAGTIGDASAFSFYPTKVMTSGEGGMIVTRDEELVKTARILRDQGKAGFTTNLHVEMGYNWRLSELHAALGVSQLRRLQEFIKKRRHIARIYDDGLRNMDWIRPLRVGASVHSNYYKYLALLDPTVDRGKIKASLRERLGVSLAGEVYDVPLHKQPVFEKIGAGRGSTFPVADELCRRHVCLPMSAVMSDEEAKRVVAALGEASKWS